MRACSRASCYVCSSSGTGYLIAWLIRFGGGSEVDPHFWVSSTSHVHFHSRLGTVRWGS